MSISLILMPLAIALAVTVKASIGDKFEIINDEQLPPVETIFNDTELLIKTLTEHGVTVTVISENKITCCFDDITLTYSRQSNNEHFYVHIAGVKDYDKFFTEISCFECEYKQNVQSFTYNSIIESLDENNMKVVNETVLEDNSILLTIDV